MRENDAVERNWTERLRTDVVAFLCCGQQRMENLDGRLEHLDKFEQSLIGAAESPREGISIGIVLAEMFQLADIDFAHQ